MGKILSFLAFGIITFCFTYFILSKIISDYFGEDTIFYQFLFFVSIMGMGILFRSIFMGGGR